MGMLLYDFLKHVNDTQTMDSEVIDCVHMRSVLKLAGHHVRDSIMYDVTSMFNIEAV